MTETKQPSVSQDQGGRPSDPIRDELSEVDFDDTSALGFSARPTIEDVTEALKDVVDPELGINIVDLGLIYECEVKPNEDGSRHVEIKMTLTAPGCGMGDVLVQDIRQKLEIIPTVSTANVELVFDPPWNQSMMSEAARLQTGMF